MTPEEKARKIIDGKLEQSGWVIQDLAMVLSLIHIYSGIGNRRTMDYFGCATGKRRRTMAQSDFEEKLEIEKFHIESTDVMTGDRNKNRFLLYQLKLSMAQAKQIDIIVAFLMESGVRMLLKDLKAALNLSLIHI